MFFDSGGFIALLVKNDRNHGRAMTVYPVIKSRGKVTTSLVVSEAYTWLRYHVGFQAAVAFWERLLEDEEKGRIALLRPDRGLEERALVLARRYADVSLSLTDALSLAVIQEHRIREVFGFDRHFFLVGCQLLPLSADA
ncbi:MAG: type II toxin-antitoxin system VapC family toxin [Clostridia bacterium]|nr:type II toxin-antitoxin system VapC family toxin [Clostridia bacterium]